MQDRAPAPPASLPAPHRPAPGGEVVLEARDLEKRYGQRAALKGVSIAAARGDLLGVIGPNGAGKTTLLAVLAGIERPDGGEVARAPTRTGWVPQQPAVYGKLTVAENLRLFAQLERCGDPADAADRMLTEAGLREQAAEQVGRLSGGNRHRVNIAIGLIGSPSVLLLDEPSAALDPRQRERLWDFLLRLAAGGTTIVYSSHNVQEVERHARSVLVLADGEALFSGSPRRLEEEVGASAAGSGSRFENAFVSFLRARGH